MRCFRLAFVIAWFKHDQALLACSIRSGLWIALNSLSTASSEPTRIGHGVWFTASLHPCSKRYERNSLFHSTYLDLSIPSYFGGTVVRTCETSNVPGAYICPDDEAAGRRGTASWYPPSDPNAGRLSSIMTLIISWSSRTWAFSSSVTALFPPSRDIFYKD